MTLELITNPVIEPVSVAELKEHLRLSHEAEDDQITHYIKAAREWVERELSLALIEQTWRYQTSILRDDLSVRLPVSPLINVTIIHVGNNEDPLDPTRYFIEYHSDRAKIVFRYASDFSTSLSIKIEFIVGYGSDADFVPAPLKQAVILIASHWFEHREVSGSNAVIADIPQLSNLLAPYRRLKLA